MRGWSFAGSMLKSTVVLSPLPQSRELRSEQRTATRLISTCEENQRNKEEKDSVCVCVCVCVWGGGGGGGSSQCLQREKGTRS